MRDSFLNKIFNKEQLNEIKKLKVLGIDVYNVWDKEILSIIPNEIQRIEFYSIILEYPLDKQKEIIDLYKKIYANDGEYANLFLYNLDRLKDFDFEFLIENKDKIRHILVELKGNFVIKDLIFLIDNYGYKVIDAINEENNLIIILMNKEIIDANLKLDYILKNKNMINSILLFPEINKKKLFLKMLVSCPDILEKNYNRLEEINFDILSFFDSTNWKNKNIELIINLPSYERLNISSLVHFIPEFDDDLLSFLKNNNYKYDYLNLIKKFCKENFPDRKINNMIFVDENYKLIESKLNDAVSIKDIDNILIDFESSIFSLPNSLKEEYFEKFLINNNNLIQFGEERDLIIDYLQKMKLSLEIKELNKNVYKDLDYLYKEDKNYLLKLIENNIITFSNNYDYLYFLKNKDKINYIMENSNLINHYKTIVEWNDEKFEFFKKSNFKDELFRVFSSVGVDKVEYIFISSIILTPQLIDEFLSYFKEKNNLYLYKKTIYYMYCGTNLPNELRRGVFKNIDDIHINIFLKMMDDVIAQSSIEGIDKVISKYNLEPNILKFRETLNSALVKQLNDAIFKLPDNYKIIDGVKIIDDDIMDLTEFIMITHGISCERTSENGDIARNLLKNPQLWEDETVKGSSILSTRITQEFHNHRGYSSSYSAGLDGSLTLGFSNLEDFVIVKVSYGDGKTDMSGKTEFTINLSLDNSENPINIINSCIFNVDSYNQETAFFRQNKVGNKILPSFIVSYKNYNSTRYNNGISESMKKWAKYYDIPIVVLDGDKIYKKAVQRLAKNNRILNSGDLSLELFEDMHRRISTIEDVKGIKLDERGLVFEKFLDICDKNITQQNIETINKVVSEYTLDGLIKCIEFGTNNCNIKDELRRQKLSEYVSKIEYLNNKYVEMNNLNSTKSSIHK